MLQRTPLFLPWGSIKAAQIILLLCWIHLLLQLVLISQWIFFLPQRINIKAMQMNSHRSNTNSHDSFMNTFVLYHELASSQYNYIGFVVKPVALIMRWHQINTHNMFVQSVALWLRWLASKHYKWDGFRINTLVSTMNCHHTNSKL